MRPFASLDLLLCLCSALSVLARPFQACSLSLVIHFEAQALLLPPSWLFLLSAPCPSWTHGFRMFFAFLMLSNASAAGRFANCAHRYRLCLACLDFDSVIRCCCSTLFITFFIYVCELGYLCFPWINFCCSFHLSVCRQYRNSLNQRPHDFARCNDFAERAGVRKSQRSCEEREGVEGSSPLSSHLFSSCSFVLVHFWGLPCHNLLGGWFQVFAFCLWVPTHGWPRAFDASLGFPGEGPRHPFSKNWSISTMNIGSLKTSKLWKASDTDVTCLQETRIGKNNIRRATQDVKALNRTLFCGDLLAGIIRSDGAQTTMHGGTAIIASDVYTKPFKL